MKKFISKITALLLAIATAITALPITALAEIMVFGGNSNSSVTYSYGTGFKYGYQQQLVSWRISLYVSTSDDGTIDPARDSIVGQQGLGYVGTILYDNFTNLGTDVYYQLMYTADTRNATLYDAPASGEVRTFPYMTKVNSDDAILEYSNSFVRTSNGGGQWDYTDTSFTPDGSPIYHNTTDLSIDYGLPKYALQCNGKVVEDAVSTHEFAQQIIEDMNRHLGGSDGNFYPLYEKVIGKGLGSEPKKKLNAAGDLDLLLPTNDDCVVEWCLVVEPIGEYTTIYQPSFWDCTLYDDFWECWEQVFIGLGVQTTIGLDAYAVAQYNEKSKEQYTFDEFVKVIRKNIPDFEPIGHLSGKANYTEVGKLIAEYHADNIKPAATMNYDCHTECNPYCGVPVAGSSGLNLNYDGANNAQTAATYGGISVYTTDKDQQTTPVYYYIYDENNNFLRKETKSYTQNETHTFTPSDEYGIPIAMESTSRGDKRYCEFRTIIRDLFADILFIQYLAKQNTLW